MPIEWDDVTHTNVYVLRGVLFSKVIKQKITEGSSQRNRERITSILPEIIPINISKGCTSSKISVPIPSQPALRMRMGFQGPTLQLTVYLHTYDVWKDYPEYYAECCKYNFYNTWKWGVAMEDLIKVSATTDVGTDEDTVRHIVAFDANPKNHDYGDPFSCDLDDTLQKSYTSSYSALLQIKPETYWWVRKKEIRREAGWADKFRMELTLERSWQWSTTGRQRPAYDCDVMECFKDGETGYVKITKEYSSDV
jgi:hypothetical protein